MARIVWPGGALENVWAGTPADRLNGFAPAVTVVGQRRTLLASGAPRVWAYRTDYTATFVVRDLPNTALSACLSLARHLAEGGTVLVETGDRDAALYGNCALAPDADVPQPELSDPVGLRYSMTFTLVNLDGAPILARY